MKNNLKSNWVIYYFIMVVLSVSVIGFIYLAKSVEVTAGLINKPQEIQSYTVDDTIYRLLRKYQGVSYDKAVTIVTCESQWDSGAKNKQSTASGYFQFTFSTWYEGLQRLGWSNLISPFDGERNLELGIYYLYIGQEYRWSASKHCWNK